MATPAYIYRYPTAPAWWDGSGWAAAPGDPVSVASLDDLDAEVAAIIGAERGAEDGYVVVTSSASYDLRWDGSDLVVTSLEQPPPPSTPLLPEPPSAVDYDCDRGLHYIPDHTERALDQWMSQFRHTVTGAALMRAICAAVQRVEFDLYDLWVSTRLGLAQGHALDQWGAVVGEPRAGLDDDDYRVFIEARILANNALGDAPTLQRVVEIVTAPSTVKVIRLPPQSTEVVIRRETYMSDARARRVGRLIRTIKPAAGAIWIVEYADGYLGFDGDADGAPLDLGELARNL